MLSGDCSDSYRILNNRYFPTHKATHQFFTRNRMVSCHDPSGSDISASVSPFASPELQPTGCFAFMPTPDGSEGGNEGLAAAVAAAAAVAYLQPPPPHPPPHPPGLPPGMPDQRRWLTSTTATASAPSAMVDYSTAEINRNLELLTEKVTKLAIEGEFSLQCRNFFVRTIKKRLSACSWLLLLVISFHLGSSMTHSQRLPSYQRVEVWGFVLVLW